jgi:hypothetical protein
VAKKCENRPALTEKIKKWRISAGLRRFLNKNNGFYPVLL